MTNNKGDILAVDDTPASLKLLTDTLKAEGYQVRSAMSGELALEAAASDPPELALLDIRMPGMDGFEVCRRLKAQPETRDIPIIFVSALSETVEKVVGFELGAVDYVTKPYQREELLARVRTHLELHHLRQHFEKMLGERTAELRASEEATARMNRELRAISNCGQALMRASDEQTLLNDVCRIVYDEAGYRMVFVAYAENDEAKTIRPVAWAGAEEGYLEQAKLTWADTERGRGPSGTAVRTGESAVINDFSTDLQVGPWRDAALRRGYRSVIALPLKHESANTFGILAIYSTEPNAFTPNEIRLLEELAGDLAFGVTALRNRIGRKKADEKVIKSEERLRLSLEAAHIGSFDWDIKNDVFAFSPTYYSMLGHEPKSDYGDRSEWLAQVYPEDRPIAAEQIQNMLSGNFDQYSYEVRMLHADGAYRWQHVKGYAVEHDDDGKVTRILGVRIDITERKRAEDEIAQLNHELQRRLEALEEANKELETFSYSVSHDLKIPLRAIDGFICILREECGSQLTGEGRRYLDVVRKNTARMGWQIDGLLDFISLSQQ
jgi:PAS domain S-box-containing protein